MIVPHSMRYCTINLDVIRTGIASCPDQTFEETAIADISAKADKGFYVLGQSSEPPAIGQDPAAPQAANLLFQGSRTLILQADSSVLKQLQC